MSLVDKMIALIFGQTKKIKCVVLASEASIITFIGGTSTKGSTGWVCASFSYWELWNKCCAYTTLTIMIRKHIAVWLTLFIAVAMAVTATL